MHLGSKSKECRRSHIIVARAEGEGDKYTIWGIIINFLHEERKMRRLFFARRPYSTHFTRRVEKKYLSNRDIWWFSVYENSGYVNSHKFSWKHML